MHAVIPWQIQYRLTGSPIPDTEIKFKLCLKLPPRCQLGTNYVGTYNRVIYKADSLLFKIHLYLLYFMICSSGGWFRPGLAKQELVHLVLVDMGMFVY